MAAMLSTMHETGKMGGMVGTHPIPSCIGRWRRGPWPAVGLLVLAMLVVYGQVCRFGFLAWDDPRQVVDNGLVNPPSWRGLADAWRQPYWGLYIPLSYTWFALEAMMARRGGPIDPAAGLDPLVFHLGNLLLHVGCVLLVFVILRRLLAATHGPLASSAGIVESHRASPLSYDAAARRKIAAGAACAGALLFGLHPLQVESVAWISEARGLHCGLFSLLAIWLYLRYAEGPALAFPIYLTATVALAAALLAKPAAVAVPLLVAAIDRGLLHRPWRRVFGALGPWLALAAAQIVLTKWLQPDTLRAAIPPLWTRPLVAGDALTFYLWKLLWPWQLGPDYGRTPQWGLAQGWFYFLWLTPLLLVGTLCCLRSRRLWLTALGLFVAGLLPVLGLVPFDYQRISTVADRYVYLAMLGPSLALAWLLAKYWNAWSLGGAAALCLALGLLSVRQTSYWRDTSTLFEHVQELYPSSAAATYHLGLLDADAGHHAEAIVWYRRGLAEHPKLAEFSIALGKSLQAIGQQLFDRGQYQAAIEQYRQAIAAAPCDAEAHQNLGAALAAAGQTAAARRQDVIALQICPHSAIAHYNLANLLLQDPAMLSEAVTHYEAALRAKPDYAQAHANLGIALLQQGRFAAAIEHERLALQLNTRLTPALVHLGRALEAAGHKAEAAAAYRRALQLLPADSEPARQVSMFLRACTEK